MRPGQKITADRSEPVGWYLRSHMLHGPTDAGAQTPSSSCHDCPQISRGQQITLEQLAVTRHCYVESVRSPNQVGSSRS